MRSVDLIGEIKRMKNIQFSPPDITEAEISEVADALRSGWITTGGRTKQFEKNIAQYIGTGKAACLNSDTAAMEMTLRVLGVGEGDEVITSAYTYTASAAVIEHVGAKIVLVDTEKETPELNYTRLENAITERTKAVIPVDVAGMVCDYERINDIVEKKRVLFRPGSDIQKALGRVCVIADSAHGFGAKREGIRSGNFADFTCFSFHAVKNLTTAEGGAVTWKSIEDFDDEEIYRLFMLYSLHGQSKDALSKTKPGSWEYDIVMPGFKCNMTDIQAAIGLKQLERYEDLLARRREIYKLYEEELLGSGVDLLRHMDGKNVSSCHLMMARVGGADEKMRNAAIEKMAEYGVATNVHYKPLPMFTAYKRLGFDIADYPNAFSLYENEITLPLHTKLTDDDVKYVCDSLIKSIKQVRL